MYPKSFYANINTAVWLGVPFVIMGIAVVWSILTIWYNRSEKSMQSVVELCFPTIFSEQLIIDQIHLPTAKDRIVLSDAIQYQKQTCFEGRKIKVASIKTWIYYSMFFLAMFLFSGAIAIFLSLLLVEMTYDCDFKEDYFKDCFLFDSPNDSPPLNCSSEVNATTEVICFRLVFDFNIAAGVSYGLFKLSAIMFHIVAVICLGLIGHCTCCFQNVIARVIITRINIMLVCYSPMIALCVVLSILSSPEDRIAFRKKLPPVVEIQLIFACVSTLHFAVTMPWEKMVDTQYMERLFTDPPDEGCYLLV